MALGLTRPLTKMCTKNISWGVKAAGVGADNLTIFMCRLSGNLGTSDSWNPQGLSRPVMGLLLYRKVSQKTKYSNVLNLISFSLSFVAILTLK